MPVQLAVWEVGSIKIERTLARNIFLYFTENGKKVNFLVKRFSMGNCFGAGTNRVLNALRIQKMQLVWVDDPPF